MPCLSAYFHDPFADPIYSGYFVENERSARVLTRLGFSPLGNPVARLYQPHGRANCPYRK